MPDSVDTSALLEGSGPDQVGVDEMLTRFAGEFGTWQRRHFVLTSLAWALNAFHTLVVVFTDHKPAGSVGLDRDRSIVEEWGLVGKERGKAGLAQSVFFVGSMVGAGVFGHLSDSLLGRKGTLTLTLSMNAIFGFLTSLSPSYPFYAALRFLTGLSTGGVSLSAFVLTTEPIGPAWRGIVAMSTFYFFSLGTIALSIMSLLIPSWRYLYVASSIPSLLFVIVVLPFISESPRWHLVQNNIPSAMNIMQSIAKTNNRQIPDSISLTLDINTAQKQKETTSSTIVDVIWSPVTRTRLAITVTINLLGSIVYYGLTLNVTNLTTDLHLSVILNALAEIPAYALTALFIGRCGRRPLMISMLWLAAAACTVASFVMGGARTAFGMVGIFAATATFDLLFVYTAELFPTTVRSAALGCVSQAGQAGAVVAPMLVVLGGVWAFVVFGVCGLVGGVLGLGLPETLDRPLYETMKGLENGEEGKNGYGLRSDKEREVFVA